MTNSTISPNKTGRAKAWQAALAAALWLLIWAAASRIIDQEMLLASPVSVARRLFALAGTAAFWQSVLFSVSRMLLGFGAALLAGLALAGLAYKMRFVEVFLSPMMGVMKAAPVASYIILCLLLMPSSRLSAVIAFVMALPIVYTNTLGGLRAADPKLLEMARVFGVGPARRIVYIYFSELMPFLVSTFGTALALCWKAGVAAEVIGLPAGSIGEKLYQSKVFVDTPGVLAWTVVVILISWLFEKVLVALLWRLAQRIERV